ncbi:hypothetical protein Tco_1532910 [Tanacetum coccineum]
MRLQLYTKVDEEKTYSGWRRRRRIRAFEQETRDLDMENEQKKKLKASYSVTTLFSGNIMAEGEIDNLTMEQYLALTRGNQAPGLGTVDSWDLLKKAFIQRYCPLSNTAKQLEEIRNFKQEGDKTLYQAWERYNDLLYKCPTHDINSHQKVNIFYNGLGIINRQLLDSQGPTSGMTIAQALTAIQTMADHSQKWHNGSSNRNIDSGSNSEEIPAIISKLDSLGRNMKKLKENVHAIQVGCQTCGGAHLDKECPLNEEVKSIEEVKYGEFGRPFPNNNRNDCRFNRGVSRYGSHDQPSSGERRPSLTEIINKYMEEVAKRHAEQDEWLIFFYQNTKTNCETHDKIIQGLEMKVRTLMNEMEGRTNGGKFEECKAIFTEDGSPLYTPFYYSSKEIEYFLLTQVLYSTPKSATPKEQDLGSFILPCSIGRLDFNNALADLGASISVMPFSMYKHLGMGKLLPINMVVEIADNTKCTPKGIVKNLLVKIDKFIFPVDFVILDMVEDFRMPIILGKPLLAITHAKVYIFRKSISLDVGNEKVKFKMRSCFTTTIIESVRAVRSTRDDNLMNIDLSLYKSVANRLLGIDPCVFTYDIDEVYNITDRGKSCEMETKEETSMEPLISMTSTKKKEELSLNDWMKIRYGKVCKMARERNLKDHWRERFRDEEDEENLEDPE